MVYGATGYIELDYPGGDVPAGAGVCTDLVTRAFRRALGVDLQRAIHEDRDARPWRHTHRPWEGIGADANIDHRRCASQYVYFRSYAAAIPTDDPTQWRAGDIIFFRAAGKRDPWHVGIIGDRRDNNGDPLIIDLHPPRAREVPVRRLGRIHSIFRWMEEAESTRNPDSE